MPENKDRPGQRQNQGRGNNQDRQKQGQQGNPCGDELEDISRGVTADDQDVEDDERITQRHPQQGGDVDRKR